MSVRWKGLTKMYELVEYLSRGPCVVIVGAGPSSEIGLPDWQGLAEEVLTALRKVNPKDLEQAELDFARNDFPSLLGRAWRSISQKFVIDVCQRALKDTGKIGPSYKFLTSFPFKGYLTTNIEDILARHFKDAGQAATVLGNEKAELEQVDFDVLRCVVKLHGSLEKPDFLVLTDDQYDAVIHNQRFEALRTFLSSHVSTSRILFIGYSLSDPDLQFLLKNISHRLRRKVPLFAIVANAGDGIIDDWDRKYNIRIVPYHARKKAHQELGYLLDVLSRYVALKNDQLSVPSLKIAQSLYMWHRFQSDGGSDARRDAFKALVLAALSASEQPMSKPALTKSVAALYSMKSDKVETSISAALDAAVKEGLVETPSAQLFRASAKGIDTQSKFSRQFDNLKSEFLEQVKLDLRKGVPDTSAANAQTVSDAVLDALVVCMAERGSEVVDTVFASHKMQKPHVTLLKQINIIAAKLPESCRYFFTSYVTTLLTSPVGVQEKFLDYIAKAYFAINALGLDPDGELIRKTLIEGNSLVLDANVIIPTLTIGSANHGFFYEVIQKAKEAGIKVWVTPRFIDETLHHFQWASDLVRQHGEQSVELLAASMGRGQYRRNECLDGFVRYVADGHQVAFEEYIELCIGALDFKAVKDKAAEHGIDFLPLGTLTKDNSEFYVVRDESEAFINSSAAEMAAELPEFYKSEARMRAEAEVYAVVYSWQRLRPKTLAPEQWRCSFLSRGTFLNKIAAYGPYKLDGIVTVRPDLLYEFLSRFEGSGNLRVPLKDLLLATHFRAADYFIDKQKYATFFAPLIHETERTYKENLESFRRLVSGELNEGSLRAEEQLERPFVLISLDAESKAVLREEVHRLEDENIGLKASREAADREIARLKAQLKARK